jgi:hypothetical protein
MMRLLEKVVCFRAPLKAFALIISFITTISTSYGASFYWVGGTGSWENHAQHWAAVSGGQLFYDHEPTAADDVFFDEHSFPSGGTLTMAANLATCKNMTWMNISNPTSINGASGDLSIYGSLTLSNRINWKYKGSIYFNGPGQEKKITTAGCQLADLYFEASSAEWILQDALTCNSFSLMAGNLKTNDQTVRCSRDVTIAGDTLELGSSIVHCMYWTNYMDVTNTTHALAFDAGTSTIYCFQFRGIHQSYHHLKMISVSGYSLFISNGCTVEDAVFPIGETIFYEASNNAFRNARFNGPVILNGNTVFKNARFMDNCILNDSNVFDTVTFDNPGKTISLEPGKTQTIHSVFKILSADQQKITLKSSIPGVAAVLSSGIPELCFEYLAMQDITVSGGTIFKAGNYSEDLGNNSGCFFTNCSATLSSWPSDDVKNNGLRISEIYPNPVNSLACFQVESDHGALFLVVITDYTGNVCSNKAVIADKDKAIITIDFSTYTQGVYFMKIIDRETGKSASKKVVKE